MVKFVRLFQFNTWHRNIGSAVLTKAQIKISTNTIMGIVGNYPQMANLTFTITNGGLPSDNYIVLITDPHTMEDLAVFSQNLPSTQSFLISELYKEQLIQIFEYNPPRTGISKWTEIGIGNDNFVFEMGGESSGGGGSLPYPSGSSKVEGKVLNEVNIPVSGKIVRVYHRDSGLLLAGGFSGADGNFSITIPTTNSEILYLTAIDPDKLLSPPISDYVVAQEI